MGKENDESTRQRREIDPSTPQGGSQAGPTRIAGRPPSGQGKAPDGGGQGPTVINPPPGAPAHTTISRPPQPDRPGEAAEAFQPVTGWLVAVAGPGRGKARAIFEGRNAVGRDPGQRIPLDFNDTEISREKHFFITYERKKRSFYISIGEKENLVYLDGDVVLDSKVLNEGCEIEVGKTKLRFVPLCGPGFSWDEA